MTPVKWFLYKNADDLGKIDNLEEIEKQAKAIQLINMFRTVASCESVFMAI